MYLARQRQIEISATSGDGTCALQDTRTAAERGLWPPRGSTTLPAPSSLLPSSPPPISPTTPKHRRGHREIPAHTSRAWASPGEWDDPGPGSPLPSSTYEHMPWPTLFKGLFGPKGDAQLDTDEVE
ncbi:hypothetical protein DFH09DRAFT_1096391 [Mycena vulgaris]|nr:hypothetical protein DFH09DRAFT_1096391 [Mycena vulgaris]